MSHIELEIDRGFGVITLNRPETFNAIDLDMVCTISDTLDNWKPNPAVEAVMIRSSVPKAFCAGGDMKKIRDLAIAGDYAACDSFFAEEYAMNLKLATYPRPVVSLINGVCMGGGVGLSIYSDYRVVTDRTRISMPETLIGFFPDIGGSWFLPRLPGRIGSYLALSGRSVTGLDSVHAGFATHLVAEDVFEGLQEKLKEVGPDDIADVLGPETETSASLLAERSATIDALFVQSTVGEIIHALKGQGGEWGEALASDILKRAPTSLVTTHDLLAAGAEMTLDRCLQQEFLLTQKFMRNTDFHEGVRAVLVDKDEPSWAVSSLEEAISLLEGIVLE